MKRQNNLMGRTPTINKNLPKGVRARKQRSGKVYYYLELGNKEDRREMPLGDDYVVAIQKWAELTKNPTIDLKQLVTFKYVSERYIKEALPLKAPRTQRDNITQLAKLLEFFDDDPPLALERIEPIHVRQFMTWRGTTAKVRANREKALLSHL